MTAYSIEIDELYDAAIEAARAKNEPNMTAEEYLVVCFKPVIEQIARDYEPDVLAAKEALQAAEEAREDKYQAAKANVEARA